MKNINKISVVAVLLSAVFFVGSCGNGGGGGSASPATMFTATLTLAQEVPTPTTPAGVAPTGSGSVTLDPVTKVLTGSFTTMNVVGATAAHIHDGDVGLTGAVVVPLTQTTPGTWTVPTVPATVLTDAQIARLRAGGYYVNVHTTLNAAGEIRGQLVASSTTVGY